MKNELTGMEDPVITLILARQSHGNDSEGDFQFKGIELTDKQIDE